MAKLPSLVNAIAAVDGRDLQTVGHIAHTIREAGFIETGKRGGGAADMTARDAANLIIALNGADTPKDSPLAITRFRSLKIDLKKTVNSQSIPIGASQQFIPIGLTTVANSQNFGVALELVIDQALELARFLHRFAVDQYSPIFNLTGLMRLGAFDLDISMERYGASIRMVASLGTEECELFSVTFVKDQRRITSDFYGSDWPDRKVRSTVGLWTILAAWHAINPNRQNEDPFWKPDLDFLAAANSKAKVGDDSDGDVA